MKIKAYNIDWDLTDEGRKPEGMEGPDPIQIIDDYDGELTDEAVCDCLSDRFGFCVNSFDWTILDDGVHDEHYPDDREMVSSIRQVLRRYFVTDSNGRTNPQYNPNLEPQTALDDIANIVCEF